MKRLSFIIFAVFALFSCSKEIAPNVSYGPDNPVSTESANVSEGILRFATPDELNSVVNSLKEGNSFDLSCSPITKSTTDFVSLRQSLIEQGLREFTDEELTLIQQEGLIYEPEDSIISDPYFCTVLNSDREIIVGNNVYRYVEEGVVSYNVDDLPLIKETIDQELQLINTSDIQTGQTVTLNNNAQFTKLEYADKLYVETDSEILANAGQVTLNPRPPTSATPPQTEEEEPYIAYGGNKLTLSDGTKISGDKLRKITYKHGGDNDGNNDINWFEDIWDDAVGLNVYAIQEFDSKHRMKVRLFTEDYIIYRSVGMTVRMQKKVLGIWWKIMADEFRYGWSAIECKYVYDQALFPQPPSFNGLKPSTNIPDVMKKNFPFANEDIVLVNLDFLNYNFTTGDLNNLLASGIKAGANKLQGWINSGNASDKDNPKGLFTVDEEDRTVYVIYPQGEDFEYDKGREVVRWDCDWFDGNYIIGFNIGIGYRSFGVSDLTFERASEIKLGRACIYAAVKYDDEWRGCIIKTE